MKTVNNDMRLKKIMLLIYGFCFALISAAQKNVISHKIERMEPPNWWIGMQHSQVQIIFYGPGISALEATTDSRNAKILDIHKTSNPNYVFVNVDISEVKKEEIVHFNFKSKGKTVATQDFPILQRRQSASRGLEGNETMYLAFPDRFCNGNPKNDEVAEMSEKKIDRKALKGRHGGDLQGVMQQLPYLKELGVTALWLNPILENDQPDESYHGYAATHLYKVDERLG
ncbi:MAG: cyclomaltodextrinase N-terminal domain-containing protein, partial [Flavobacteriales bacterium]